MSRIDIAQLHSLAGKVAIVTGSAQGIGRATALMLASAGATVAVADRDGPGVEKLAAEITGWGGKAEAFAYDQADEASIVAMMDAVEQRLGGIDILVNNAGVQDRAYLNETSADLWDRIHRINLRGVFLCLREGAKRIAARGPGGRIINIASLGSIHPLFRGIGAYNSAKAGVNGLTRQAAYEYAGDGITVNAVLPGAIATPGGLEASGPHPTDVEIKRMLEVPAGSIGQPEDIAHAVLFLASPASSYITGQLLAVEGGRLLM